MTKHEAPSMGPLAGVTILDLTRMLAGPYCTMLLGDLGATIVKVEPLAGDYTRGLGPFAPEDQKRVYGGYFQSINRGKRSIAIDLTSDDGRTVLESLVSRSDALVENFRAGVMDRFGLSYEHLSQMNDRLVYASIRGFGDPRTGPSPYVDWPSYDVVAQAMGGLVGITGTGPGMPLKVGAGVGDIFPAALAALGVVSALFEARQSAAGRYVDVALYDSVIALCERIVFQYSYEQMLSEPYGNAHPLVCPFGVFPALDGHVAIAAVESHHWRTLCEAMERPELADLPGLQTATERHQRADEVISAIEAWTTSRTKAEILEQLGGRVAVGPVNTARDIFKDEHVRIRDMLVEVDHPGCPEPMTLAGSAIKFLPPVGSNHTSAPLLGEHTDSILREAGFADTDITALRERRIVA